MKLGKKNLELFTVVPGNPWTINGEPSPASNPQEAVAEILAVTKRFPARINVHDGEQIIALEMDKQGRTKPASSDPEEIPGEDIQESAPVPTPAPVSVGAVPPPPPADQAEPAAAGEEPAEAQAEPRRKITPLRVAGAAVLILALAAGAALTLPGSDDDPRQDDSAAAAAAPTAIPDAGGWLLPQGQEALAVLGNRIITAQGNTVRVLDADTGEPVGESYDVPDPEQIRFIEGQAASAFDPGAGQVIVLRENSAKAVEGVLNARGTEPVIVQGTDYVDADGTKRPLMATQAVLAATDEDVVLIESPGKAIIGDRSVDLKAPEPETAITQLVSATDSRVVVLWSRGETRLLTTHDVGSGEAVLKEDIAAAEVTVRSGIVWIGADRYLQGDRIEQVCQGFKQVNATIICPAADGWESAADGRRFPELPEAVSKTYSITAGTVTNLRTEK